MLREELKELCAPVLRKVLDHPFWSGLRDGSLPGESLARFVRQDSDHLLPAYARALARCAAAAPDDADAYLFGQSVTGTLAARDELRGSYTSLQDELDLPELGGKSEILPATHAHTAFFAEASAASFHSGVGALLPMVWFNAEVSDSLRYHAAPGTRYLPWIESYHPGDSYQYVVQAFFDLADRAGESGSASQRRRLIEQFSFGIRYEWAFADCCAGHSSWPV